MYCAGVVYERVCFGLLGRLVSNEYLAGVAGVAGVVAFKVLPRLLMEVCLPTDVTIADGGIFLQAL